MLYVVVWVGVLYLLPAGVSTSAYAAVFVGIVESAVPSIGVYAAIAPDPPRVALFMAIHWAIVPVHVYLGYRSWARRVLQARPGFAESRFSAWVGAVGMLTLVVAAMYLPTEVAIDPYAIRPSRQWSVWMTQSILPHGLLSIAIGPGVAMFILIAWLLLALPTTSARSCGDKE